MEHKRHMRISETKLSARAKHALHRKQVTTVMGIESITFRELANTPNCGEATQKEIIDFAKKMGVSFAKDWPKQDYRVH